MDKAEDCPNGKRKSQINFKRLQALFLLCAFQLIFFTSFFIIGTVFHCYAQGKRIFLIAGQSNALGAGGKLYSEICLPNTAFEYINNNMLIPLEDPMGNIDTSLDGSAWPAFAKKYNSISNDTIIVVQTAAGGSSLLAMAQYACCGTWDSSGTLFSQAINLGINARNFINKKIDGIIWIQGETDADAINNGLVSATDYKEALIKIYYRFKEELGPDLPFFIVKTGYNLTGLKYGHDEIRKVQQQVASTIYFGPLGWHKDNLHYNQVGLNNMGRGLAREIDSILNTTQLPIKNVDNFLSNQFDQIIIFDLMGKKVFDKEMNNVNVDIFLESIGNPGVPSGFYIVKAINGNRIFYKKIFIR